MYFAYDDAQEAIRATTRSFLEDVSGSVDVRRLIGTEDGFDPEVWRTLASKLGLVGLLIPEEHGGSGLGFIEQSAVLHEMGRALFCGPYLSSAVLAPTALAEMGDEASRKEWLPAIASGDQRIALALGEDAAPISEARLRTTARGSGASLRIHGRKRFVIDGASATSIFVVARCGDDSGGQLAGQPGGQSDDIGLFAVEPDAPGLTRTRAEALDPTRQLAHLEFDATPARPLGAPGPFGRVARLLSLTSVALAAEQAGGAERTLEDAVRYAKERVQFDRPIGQFQAIKHKAADMLIAAESAKAASLFAAWKADRERESLGPVASVAQATCSEAYLTNAGHNFQIHGGVAFTWEYDAHLHLRRARASWALFGSPSMHRESTAVAMGLR